VADRGRDIRKFERAADQRLTVAQFLLESGFHYDAEYLAGYAVECALKALILKRTPSRRYEMMYHAITHGKQAHDFETLQGILKRPPINCMIEPDIADRLRRVAFWTTDMRSDFARVRYEEAAQCLRNARAVRDWSRRG
jgi:HEPN domain-containing protein